MSNLAGVPVSKMGKELAVRWLTDRAHELYMAASRADTAYTRGGAYEAATYTAAAYRAAALVLKDAAQAIRQSEAELESAVNEEVQR